MNKIYRSFFSLIFCLLIFTAIYGCGTGPDKAAGTGTTPTTIDLSSITLSVSSSSVTFGTPVTATATLRDANGALVPHAVVTFAPASTLVAFTPASATALTGDGTGGTILGVATIILNAASFYSAGATSITASASVTTSGTTATVTSTPIGVSVGEAAVTIHSLTLSQSSISAYGTSIVSAVIWVNGSAATVPISVAFSSPCVASGKATLTTPVTTVLGTATSTYADNNCASGTDTITASVNGVTATATINVAIPTTSNIQFVSATPTIIGIQGSGSSTLLQSSVVKFQVVDSSNHGKQGILVDFSLLPTNYASLGITMSASSATSDASGYVTTSVVSGTVPTPVWVVAKVHSTPSILTQSNTLSITTGLPTQDFFSLSVQTFNIEGWENDGVTSSLMIIASDRLGNPVPDGSVINFVTEGATITPASCTTTGGTCTVTFKSSDYRPIGETPGVLGFEEDGTTPITINGGAQVNAVNGRVSILAYAIGEKSFSDANYNNKYDNLPAPGETFYDLGVMFLDKNEDGIWQAGEFFLPYDSPVGTHSCTIQPSGDPLPTYYSTAPSKANTCTQTWGLNYVRRQRVITLSSAAPVISENVFTMASSCYQEFPLWLMDTNYNPMPAGTTVDIANNNIVYIPNGSSSPSLATVTIGGGSPVISTNHAGGTKISLIVDGGASCSSVTPVAYPNGTVNIVTKTPKGLKSNISVCIDCI